MATADDLISNIRLFGAISSFQNTWGATDLLNALNHQLSTHIMSSLLGSNQEFFTDYYDQLLVDDQSIYELPPRMASLRKVVFLDTDGVEGPPLPKIEVTDIGRYAVVASPAPAGFYYTATEINIIPTPASPTGSLRIYYVRKPSTLVRDTLNGSNHSAVATISDVTPASGNTLLTLSPTIDTTAFPSTASLDIVSATSPHRLRAKDLTSSLTTSTSMLFAGISLRSTPYNVQVGDYVTLAKTSWVPVGVPDEWCPLLEMSVIDRVLFALGDHQGQAKVEMDMARLESRLLSVVAPRSPANPSKINAWR